MISIYSVSIHSGNDKHMCGVVLKWLSYQTCNRKSHVNFRELQKKPAF